MLVAPESVAGVSFQMSFGAVVALIAVYETWGSRLGRLLRGRRWWRRAVWIDGRSGLALLAHPRGCDQ
jgi:predicted membrane metal-binding protein